MSRFRRLTCFSAYAIACALMASCSLPCSAQITLQPGADQQADIAWGPSSADSSSSRRQRSVSRNVLPEPMVQPLAELPVPGGLSLQLRGNDPSRTTASGSATDNRDQEFESIVREAEALDRQLGLIRRIVRFAGPSIVHIEASKKSGAGKGFASSRIDEAGAGVIVDLPGGQYVLTNRHVVHPAELSSIRLELNDGTSLRPSGIWADPATDVAVLKLDGNSFTAARLGDSDRMGIGDFVLAVGSPFGLSHSVTYGILSARGRRNLELGSKEIEVQDFFQTDAAINPGNSGGPLLNLRGEVIAINTAIASNSGGNEGIGFSIPINMAMVVAEQLVRRGSMRRSYLGVQLEVNFGSQAAQDIGLPLGRGALVKSVLPSSPAARAGIQVGDVILEFNGRAVENDGHLVKMVSLTPAGSQAELSLFRKGAVHKVSALLQPSPE
ncbi:MAG: trypsin-like peptidase domain-containing protein [Pirellulaceae bacterium]|nr:trypsin-like peptidase domain-containing protein [Pirellulaceae bacterium]